MAQATFSCPCGAIYLESDWGPLPVSAFAKRALIVTFPPVPLLRERVPLASYSLPAGKIKTGSRPTLRPQGPSSIKI